MADYVRHKYFERDIEPNLQPARVKHFETPGMRVY